VDQGQHRRYGPEVSRSFAIVWAPVRISEDMPRLMDDEQFPLGGGNRGADGRPAFSRIDELPGGGARSWPTFGAGARARRSACPARQRSHARRTLLGAPVRSERPWSDDLWSGSCLLSAAFSNALERKRMELSLAEALAFERLLLPVHGVQPPCPRRFRSEFQRGLRQVVDSSRRSAGSLIEFSRDGTTARSWAIEEWMDVGSSG